MDCSLPGSSAHEILQARILEWVVNSSSRGTSQLRDRTHVSCLAARLFTTEPPGKPTVYISDRKKFAVMHRHLKTFWQMLFNTLMFQNVL